MPLRIVETAGGTGYGNPIVGAIEHTAHVKLDISGMTEDEVDADGYLKPGVPLTKAGILVGASPAFPFGITFEAQKVAEAPITDAGLAALTTDPLVTVCTIGLVNR